MGISASLNSDSKLLDQLFDWKLDNAGETDYGKSEMIKLFGNFQRLRKHPEDYENVERLLLGLDGGINGTNIVGIFSLLQAASRREAIFQEVSNNSVAYLEVVMIVLSYLNTKNYGEAEGRARQFLLGLASIITSIMDTMLQEKPVDANQKKMPKPAQKGMKAAFSTTKNKASKAFSTTKQGATKVITTWNKMVVVPLVKLNDPLKRWKAEISPEAAQQTLENYYKKCRFKYLTSLGKSYPTANRSFKELEKLRLICQALAGDLHEKLEEHYGMRGAVFQIEFKSPESMDYYYRPEDAYNLSVALMDLVLPEIPEEMVDVQVKKQKYKETDVMLDVGHHMLQRKINQPFPAQEEVKINEYKLMTEPQQKMFSFITSMFKPIEQDDDLVGEYTISYITGVTSKRNDFLDNSFAEGKFMEAIQYTRKQYPERVAQLPALWQKLEDTSRDLISCLAALEMVMVAHFDALLEVTLGDNIANF